MARLTGPGIHLPHPQARRGGANDGPVHGLQTVGRDPSVGSDAVAGGVGPSAGLRVPPGAGGRRCGHGNPGPAGAGPAQGMAAGGAEPRLCQVL